MFPIRQDDGTWKTRGEAFHGRAQQDEIDRLYTKIWHELQRHDQELSAKLPDETQQTDS